MRVTIIQLNASANKTSNLETAENLIMSAITADRSDMVVLPEMFNYRGGTNAEKKSNAEIITPPGPASKTYNFLKSLAHKHQIYIHGGSLCERDGDKFYNTTLVFNRQGQEIARYRKIHLFDVVIPNGTEYKESDLITAGDAIVTYNADKSKVGCTLCYDLRFAELYQALADQGTQLIMVPSAFTHQTGEAHWEILLRARAIETQCYLIAPGQTGNFDDGNSIKSNWGHSMIIDPWGKILVQMIDEVGYTTAELNLEYLTSIRAKLPVRQHKRRDLFSNPR